MKQDSSDFAKHPRIVDEKLDSLYDISNMDCNYYLPNEFKKQLPIDEQKSQSFSLLI